MSNTLTRSQARTWTLSAQLASLACVLGAVALGVIGLPAPQQGAALERARASAGPGGARPGAGEGAGRNPSSSPAPDDADIDTAALAQRLALLDNAPVPVNNKGPEVVEKSGDDEPAPTDANDGLIVKRVRYIGFINDPDNRHAFIRIDGKQRIVALGAVARSGNEEFPDLTLERITPQHIILSDGETRASVPLAARSGQSVTMVSGDEVAVADALKPQGDSLLTPEEEAEIAALPPRQQPLARRRLEREKRGLSSDPEPRRPRPEPLVSVRGGMSGDSNRPNRRLRDDD